MCIMFVYSLQNIVGYYDFSVLSMSVMGFQKKFGRGGVGVVSSIQFFLGFFLTLQIPLLYSPRPELIPMIAACSMT